jgi:RHS repeat-associated protein
MQLSSGTQIPDCLLAAMTLLNEKPCLGVPSKNPAPHQGINERNSTAAIGMRLGEHLNSVRQSERARYYASTMGRFLSPDWSAAVEPVPYSKLDDPQTLNLYAYVLNNPIARGDIDGHVPLSWGGIEDCGERNDCSENVEEKLQAGMENQANVEANKVFTEREQAQQNGSGTAGVIYNETSTLRENGKTTGPDLHDARVAIAQVIDVNQSKEKVASPVVQDNMKYAPAAAAMADSQAAVREASTAPDGTQGATHFFLSGGKTPTPDWVKQGKVVESFGPFPVAATTHDFNKGQSATIQVIQYPAPKQ